MRGMSLNCNSIFAVYCAEVISVSKSVSAWMSKWGNDDESATLRLLLLSPLITQANKKNNNFYKQN